MGTLSRGSYVDVAYHLELNTWNGETRPQLNVQDLRRYLRHGGAAPRPDRSPGAAQATAALALLFACSTRCPLAGPHQRWRRDVHTAEALVRRGTFALAPDPALPQIVPGTDGRFYGKYDPGLPLLMTPTGPRG